MSEKATSIPEEQEAALKAAVDALDRMGDMSDAEVSPRVWQVLDCENIVKKARASLAATERQDSQALPNGWVPLTITFEGDTPEEVAYGPQIMMDRLKKWLDKFYALRLAAPTQTDDAISDYHRGWHDGNSTARKTAEVLATPAPTQALPEQPSDGDYLRWAQREGATHDEHGDPRVVFHSGAQWGRFCDRIRSALAAPTQAPAEARKPLQPDQIGALWDQHRYSGSWLQFARAIEAAHGITESAAPAAAVERSDYQVLQEGEWVDASPHEYCSAAEDARRLTPAAAVEPSRGQKLADAGYTRRPSFRSLPPDEDAAEAGCLSCVTCGQPAPAAAVRPLATGKLAEWLQQHGNF